jgi:DNA-binding MarR family transcriptional regulator
MERTPTPPPDPADQILELLNEAERSGDEQALAEVAWVLGGELASRRNGPVAAVRRHLAAVSATAPPLLRGFALAVERMASGHLAAEPAANELAPIVRAVHLRAGWRKVLEGLATGPLRPSEIAGTSGLSRGRVSHVLAALDRAGLIERTRSEGDGRERWAGLTPMGGVVLDELAHGRGDVAIDLDAAVVATTYMLAKLVARGRSSRAALEDALAEHLERPAVARIADTALRAARNAGLVVDGDQGVTLAELHLRDVLGDALEHALDPQVAAVPVIELARAQAPRDGVVVVRSERHRQRWDIVIARRRLDDLRLLASADWLTGEAERIVERGRPFVLVYDSPPLARAERITESPTRALLGRAEQVYCYRVPGTTLPDGVKALEVA